MTRNNAKVLRTNMTDAERRLWYLLRAHRFAGFKFKRQIPIGRYIVDFVCRAERLIIEVDGGQHADSSQSDRTRDLWLEDQGFRVLRFWNNEVQNNTDGVLEVILEHFGRSSRTPSPGATVVAPPSPACAASLLGGEGKKEP
ncbi:MAG: (cytosine-5-)-methyltransferase [Tardiphaga sp.]|uniref:endonuclease domain-containing protein n=1 Tax=Tardiphaga sp. TaxID=1926292 RepID=UPI0026178F5B|nr:endonuclease domain-containing protein [Tardiphaga sp.]MDB5501283.1 (cytosine-5-)-methyltransferase [Tardiphaga sp.]